MRVTLVTSPFLDHAACYSEAEAAAQAYLPLGLLALAARLRAEGFDVNIADLNDAYNRRVWWNGDAFYEAGAEFLESFEPDVLGFMTAYDSYHHVLNISRAFKARNPKVPIVLGGYQASVVSEETITHFPWIDAVVRGEGEESFVSLLRCYDTDDDAARVAGVTLMVNGAVSRNPDQPLIANLDELPIPAYDLYPIDPRRFVYLEVGRGCPFQCTYCSTSPFWRRMTRYKSPARVLREMTMLRDRYSVTQFHFVHDLFTVNNQWVRDFCDVVRASDMKAHWTCSGSIHTVDEALVQTMAGAGCAGIYFGIETGSATVGRTIKKSLDLNHAKNVIRTALEAGIAPVTGFMAGFPFETEDSLRETFRTFFDYKQLGVPLAHLFVAIPEKGSPLYQEYRHDLALTHHFLDFPVSPALAARNSALIERHADVFCGMYRFRNPNFDADFFRGIDELSPLINTVTVPVNIAIRQLNDPLAFYRGWLSWIEDRNRQRDRVALLFYGTTQDMLDYIGHLQATHILDVPYLDDLLAYEAAKNEFRRVLGEMERTFADDGVATARERATTNTEELREAKPVPSRYNKVVTLAHDIQPLYQAKDLQMDAIDQRATTILLCAAPRRQASIGDFFKDITVDITSVKLDPISAAIVAHCDGKTRVQDIAHAIAAAVTNAETADSDVAQMVVERISQLAAIGALSLVRRTAATPTLEEAYA